MEIENNIYIIVGFILTVLFYKFLEYKLIMSSQFSEFKILKNSVKSINGEIEIKFILSLRGKKISKFKAIDVCTDKEEYHYIDYRYLVNPKENIELKIYPTGSNIISLEFEDNNGYTYEQKIWFYLSNGDINFYLTPRKIIMYRDFYQQQLN